MKMVIELNKETYKDVVDMGYCYDNSFTQFELSDAIANSTALEDVLKDFLEWYTLPFNDNLFKHTDEVIQEFINYQKESTNAKNSTNSN